MIELIRVHRVHHAHIVGDAVKMGISELTDTDMEDAAARYEALSAQEQLSGLSLSIANASPGSLRSLYS